jgi:hypothetical protein
MAEHPDHPASRTAIHLRRWLIAALLLLATLVFGLPWLLYAQGLKSVVQLPPPPTERLPAAQLSQVWQRAGLEGEPAAAVLDPVSYLASAAVQARPPAVTAFAWRVASDHLHQEARALGPLEKHLAGAALTIWLTRHWNLEQLLSRSAQLDAASAPVAPVAPAAPAATLPKG